MYQLPPLLYPYDALEPHIDARTMELHHTKHHQTYVDKLNAALEKHPELFEKSLEELLKNLEAVPEDIKTAVRNHGGGHLNHSLFWKIMTPQAPAFAEATAGKGGLAEAINRDFGSFDKFKEEFSAKAAGLFGSGWCWLVKDNSGKLQIITTPNQDTPLGLGLKPVLGLDLWEHSYYIKFLWNRAEYIKSWWNVVNWRQVDENYR